MQTSKTNPNVKTAATNQDHDQNLGARNNNPTNIRYDKNNNWVGQIGSEKGFCKFNAIEYGYSAFQKTMRTYITKHGWNTPRLIIKHFAPATENNTELYVRQVCLDSGFGENEVLKFEQYTIDRLCSSMTFKETGMRPTAEQLQKAWQITN